MADESGGTVFRVYVDADTRRRLLHAALCTGRVSEELAEAAVAAAALEYAKRAGLDPL